MKSPLCAVRDLLWPGLREIASHYDEDRVDMDFVQEKDRLMLVLRDPATGRRASQVLLTRAELEAGNDWKRQFAPRVLADIDNFLAGYI